MKFENKIPTVITIGGKDVNKIRINGEVVWQKEVEPVDADYFYIENVDESDCELSFTTLSSTTLPPSDKYTNKVEFSTDKETWITWNFDTANTLIIPIGGKVYLRNDSGAFSYYGTDGYYYTTSINTTMKCNVGGNINTLLNYNEEILDISDKRSCFRRLFVGAKIVDASKLVMPATTLSQYCYADFFSGNSSLIAPPELPAVNLADFCYYNFFRNCTSLVNSPELLSTTLAGGCYMGLFYGCSKLNNITVYANDISATNCTKDWLSGVASTGTFNNMGSATYTKDSASGIPTGWTEKKPINYFYVKNEYDGTNNVTFRAVRRPTETTIQQIEYSKDKINWTVEPITANIVITIPLEKGEKVYFRNDNGYFSNNLTGTSAFRIKIRATQNHSIGGDITTLYNYSYKSGVTIPEGCFRYLFGCDLESLNSGNTFERNPNLIDASQLILPEKNLSTGCFAGMFMLATGLINPPQTIDCQKVGVESCQRMFKGSGITTTPSLSATTIGTNGCTEMFMECNNITTMPTLQATSLGEYCFSYMFSNCVNLGGIITLPATTTAKNCYSGMLKSTAITGAIIKAKTLKKNCLTITFEHCSNLNEVTVYATATSPTNLMISGITSNWLSGVASTGTFRNLGSITYDTDSVSGIPKGWTVVTE